MCGDGLRFIAGGLINTAFTYALYLLLNLMLRYQLAYLVAFAVGIVFAYWFNATIVFRVPLSWKGFFAYPSVYVVQYAASALLLAALVEGIAIDERLAPLLVTAVMIPVTYMMNRLVLGRTKPPTGAVE